MKIIEGHYFTHSRLFLKPFGLWPFQNKRTRVASQIMTLIALLTVLVPHFKRILRCIESDFKLFKYVNLSILDTYSEEARKFNRIYAIYLCLGVTIYNMTSFIPHVLDFIVPLNESRPRHVTRMVKYNIPSLDNSFYFILVHGMIIDYISMFTIIGFDTLLINCTQHACALFKVVVVELRSIALSTNQGYGGDEILEERQSINYRRIKQTIIAHKHALEFVDVLESTYALLNLLILGISFGTITMTEFETVVQKSNIDIMCRFAYFFTGQLLSILYQNYPSQRIRDHSSKIYGSCYECDWYRTDFCYKSKKLLIFMLLRSQRPSYLTAGKLFTLDLQNYVKIFRASLSYFAFLMSVRRSN